MTRAVTIYGAKAHEHAEVFWYVGSTVAKLRRRLGQHKRKPGPGMWRAFDGYMESVVLVPLAIVEPSQRKLWERRFAVGLKAVGHPIVNDGWARWDSDQYTQRQNGHRVARAWAALPIDQKTKQCKRAYAMSLGTKSHEWHVEVARKAGKASATKRGPEKQAEIARRTWEMKSEDEKTEWKRKMRAGSTSETARLKRSNALTGRKRPPEVGRKISETKRRRRSQRLVIFANPDV